MTFTDLRTALRPFSPDTLLIFEDAGAPVSPGYHITELRLFAATGIDCGGTVTRWFEARLQLLDGVGGTYMKIGKFLGILDKSLEKLPEMADLPLLVEFGAGNRELKILSLGPLVQRDDAVYIPLGPARAVCKPAEQSPQRAAFPVSAVAVSVTGRGSDRKTTSAACCS